MKDSEPLRVDFLMASCASGGTEWFALRLAQGLAALGIAPRFLAAQATGTLKEKISAAFPLDDLGGHYGVCGVLRILPALRKRLKADPPALIVSSLPLMNIALALACRFMALRPRLVMTESMRLAPPPGTKLSLRKKIKLCALGWAYARADAVVAVSHVAANDLIRYARVPPEKIKILPNPVIPEDFAALENEPPAHPWLREKTTPIVLAVGRLLKVKDFPTLLRAFAQTHTQARLLIAGEGEERAALDALIRTLGLSGRVTLAGALDNIFSAMAASDLLAVSSVSESFGNVIAEALACGLPVVSTDCGGPREILEDGKWGHLVPVGDADALARAIEEALVHRPEATAARHRGLSYGVAASALAYLALFQALLSPPLPPQANGQDARV